MNPFVKMQFLQALRSEEFAPGCVALRTIEDRYSPLGVLCALHSETTGNKWDEPKDEIEVFGKVYSVNHPMNSFYFYDGCSAFISSGVSKWSGLTLNQAATIAHMGANFEMAASFVEGL